MKASLRHLVFVAAALVVVSPDVPAGDSRASGDKQASGTSSTVIVGTVTGIRGTTVTVPISLDGDQTTVAFEADISFSQANMVLAVTDPVVPVAGAFVGAPKADVNGQQDRGRVYVYPVKTSYAAQERPTAVLDNEGGGGRDEFGRAVVIQGSAAVIGVPKADLVLVEGDPIADVGRGDAFALERLFGDGFE